MSLLNLIHKNIVITFSDAGKEQYSSRGDLVFRLDGVDAMGFLLIREMKKSSLGEPTSEAFWINKDLVREIHELVEAEEDTPSAFTTDNLVQSVTAPKTRKPRAAPKPKAIAL